MPPKFAAPIPEGFEIEAPAGGVTAAAVAPPPPSGFEIENVPAVPPGFEVGNDVEAFGMRDSLFKRFARQGAPLTIGQAAGAKPGAFAAPAPLRMGMNIGRAGRGENFFPETLPFEASLTKGTANVMEGVANLPAVYDMGQKYISHNLHERMIQKTMQAVGLGDLYNPNYDKVPEWLANNPAAELLRKAQDNIDYNGKRYPGEHAFSLWAKGDPEAAADWTLNAVAENVPYSLFTLGMTMAGVPAPLVGVAGGTLAAGQMYDETQKNDRLDEAQKFESLMLKASAEGLGEYLGAKMFPMAKTLFSSLGVKSGKTVMNEALRQALKAAVAGASGPAEEGLEEFITGIMQGATDMFYGAKKDLTWRKVIDQALLDGYVGSVSGGMYSTAAATQAALDMGSPSSISEGLQASSINAKAGADTRMTPDQLLEIQARIKAKNEGVRDPISGEPVAPPQSLNAEEVRLQQQAEDAVARDDFYEPQDEDVRALAHGLGGEALANLSRESFDDEIREKLAAGEALSPNQQAYVDYQRAKVFGVKHADVESASGMASGDFWNWVSARAKEQYESPEDILKAREIHQTFLAHNDLDSARSVRESLDPYSESGSQAAKDMLAAEDGLELEAAASDPAQIDQALAERYAKLEEMDKMPVGEITSGYRGDAEKIYAEIEKLEERKRTAAAATPKRPEIRYSTKKRESRDKFREQMEMFEEGRQPAGGHFNLGRDFKALELAGANDLDLTMNNNVLHKARGKHGIDTRTLRNLPEALERPIMIFQSAVVPDGLVVLTEIKSGGKNLVAAIHLDQKTGRTQFEVNDIRSVHPRSSEFHISNWAELGLLKYADREKANQWLLTQPDTISGSIRQRLADKSVPSEHDLVKVEPKAEKKAARAKPKTVKEAVDEMATAFENAPEVELVAKVTDLPVGVQQKDAEGVFVDGKIYLVEENIAGPSRAQYVYLHEVAGHYGLRQLLGARFSTLLDHLWIANADIRQQAVARMNERGESRLEAVEEVLADMAGKGQKASIKDYVYAFVRDALRAFGLNDLELANEDVRVLLANSRRYVREGVGTRVILPSDIRFSKKEARIREEVEVERYMRETEKKNQEHRERVEELAAAAQEGAKYGYKEGLKQGRQKLEEKMLSVVADLQARVKEAKYQGRFREAEMNLLSDIREGKIKGEMQERIDALEADVKETKYQGQWKEAELSLKAEEVQGAKDAIVDYANEFLSKEGRGDLLTQVRDAKTWLDVLKAYARVDKLADAEQKQAMVEALQKKIKKAKKSNIISVEYQDLIADIADSLSFSKPRESTIKALQATKAYLQAQLKAGNEINFPLYVYDSLEVLERTAVKDMSVAQLENVMDRVELAWNIGEAKLRAREALWDAEKNRIKKELAGIKKIQSDETIDPGVGELTLPEWFKNTYAASKNFASLLNQARTPMDHFFKNLGAHAYKTFKAAIDSRYSLYLKTVEDIDRRADEIIKKHKFDPENFRRIGVYAADQQDGGREKLLNRFTEKQIDEIKLTPAEKEFYDFMRGELEAIRPQYERVLREVFNMPLGKVTAYFPFMTDFDQMSDVELREKFTWMADYDPSLKKTVDLGSAQKRVDKVGAQKLRIDAYDVFREHMSDVVYAVHMAREIKMLQEVAKSDDFKGMAGDIGQRITAEWLDVLARKGGNGQRMNGFEAIVNFVRKNISVAMLSANPASILMQTTALLDGASLIGNYAFSGQRMMFEKRWRDFALDNSKELKDRVGDDFAFREMGKGWWELAKEKALGPQRWIDAKVAAAVWIGAYNQYLDENELRMDFEKPNAEAVAHANEKMRMSQASSSFKDMPLLMTKGIGFGDSATWGKALTQFQTPLYYRFANLESGVKALKGGDPGKAAQIIGWHVAATAAELVLRHGVVAGFIGLIMSAIAGARGDEEYEKRIFNSWWDFLKEVLLTEIGNVPIVSNAMSLFDYGSLPFPVLSVTQQVIDSFGYMSKSTNPEKKLKWGTIGTLQALGAGLGVPFTFQTSKMMKQYSRALEVRPIMRDSSPKMRSAVERFRKARTELKNQMAAIKEDMSAFDQTTINRVYELRAESNFVENLIQKYNRGMYDDLKEIEKSVTEFLKKY